MMVSRQEAIEQGKLFKPGGDEEAYKTMLKSKKLQKEYNNLDFEEAGRNNPILKDLLKKSNDVHILQPFKCEFGNNISFGEGCFVNFDCIFLDTAPINIGDRVLFGPRVTLITVGHPVDAQWRNCGDMYAFPITIKNNVWIGANVTILPGVTIGENTVIGAGSVVTKDIPNNVVACGSPCRIVREINENDKIRYFKDKVKEL